MFFSDSSTEDCLKKSLTVSRNWFVVSVKFGDSFFQEHWINLFFPNRTCKHGNFIKYRYIIINNYILNFTIFIKFEFIDSIWTESFCKDLFKFLWVCSRNKHKSILQLLVIWRELLKTFCCMLFWINCIFNYITDSGPLYFFFIKFVRNWLIRMGKRKVDKVYLILFELFENLGIIDWLDFYSLPIFVFFIGPVLWKRDNFFENLFSYRISMSEFIINNGVVIPTIGSRILATKHVHLEFNI